MTTEFNTSLPKPNFKKQLEAEQPIVVDMETIPADILDMSAPELQEDPHAQGQYRAALQERNDADKARGTLSFDGVFDAVSGWVDEVRETTINVLGEVTTVLSSAGFKFVLPRNSFIRTQMRGRFVYRHKGHKPRGKKNYPVR